MTGEILAVYGPWGRQIWHQFFEMGAFKKPIKIFNNGK